MGEHVFEEWEKVMMRKGVPAAEAEKRVSKTNLAFPDAFCNKIHGTNRKLVVARSCGRHVPAAAIKCNANVIVTNNTKDFPLSYLQSFGVDVKTADDFLTDIIDLNPQRAIAAFRKMVFNRKNPDWDGFAVLDRLRKQGLNDTANYIHALI